MIKSYSKQSRSKFSWKKLFFNITVIFFTVVITLAIFILSMASPIPSGTEEIVEEVLASEFPDLIIGDTGVVRSNAMEIWYESIMPSEEPKGTLLLIMGLGGTALEWPNFFVEPLVAAGYHVIRFDNRGTGLSTWTEHDFEISDMAADAVAVLDGLEIEFANVVGMSMGGMIAQQMAIDYPERVSTLTSYSSSANVGDPELPSLSNQAMVAMVATAFRYQIPNTEMSSIKSVMGIRKILANYIPEERKRSLVEQTIFNEQLRRRGNPNALVQHTQAIFRSGSRYDGLRKLSMPALVIHGKKDPLIPVQHGSKTASIIPDAQLLLIDDLGHDINPDYTEVIHEAIFKLIENSAQLE